MRRGGCTVSRPRGSFLAPRIKNPPPQGGVTEKRNGPVREGEPNLPIHNWGVEGVKKACGLFSGTAPLKKSGKGRTKNQTKTEGGEATVRPLGATNLGGKISVFLPVANVRRKKLGKKVARKEKKK